MPKVIIKKLQKFFRNQEFIFYIIIALVLAIVIFSLGYILGRSTGYELGFDKSQSEFQNKIEEKFAAVLTYSRLEAEKKLGGKLFRYESQEAKDLHVGLLRRIKKNSHVEI